MNFIKSVFIVSGLTLMLASSGFGYERSCKLEVKYRLLCPIESPNLKGGHEMYADFMEFQIVQNSNMTKICKSVGGPFKQVSVNLNGSPVAKADLDTAQNRPAGLFLELKSSFASSTPQSIEFSRDENGVSANLILDPANPIFSLWKVVPITQAHMNCKLDVGNSSYPFP